MNRALLADIHVKLTKKAPKVRSFCIAHKRIGEAPIIRKAVPLAMTALTLATLFARTDLSAPIARVVKDADTVATLLRRSAKRALTTQEHTTLEAIGTRYFCVVCDYGKGNKVVTALEFFCNG